MAGSKISEILPKRAAQTGDSYPVTNAGSNAQAVVPDGGYSALGAPQSFSGGQRSSVTEVASGATIGFNFDLNNDFMVALTMDATFDNPTNIVVGQKGRILITQAASTHAVAFGGYWKFEGGVIPTVSAGSGMRDILVYDVLSETEIAAALVKDLT